MSNLNRPYEISVWDDILEGEEFVEKRLGVIGSDKMLSQSRALNPKLGRNVNGTKTFQFEMYRYYTDNITGEKIENPFTGWLISERKIKLKYAGKWYDFIIKDITENSSTYLYTYKLEDAAVIELSKNGFAVILDEQRNNNLGNPKTLAERVLEDTDWKVESEVVVQKVEDALVRVTIPVGTTAVHLLDQTDLSTGVQETTTTITKDGADRIEVLAFYSSCANKPHRFQFIYLDNLADITTDKEGKINNTNCQYYIDFESPEDDYYKVENTPFFLPNGFSLYYKNGGYLYTDARAERYSFAHQTDYIPKLDRYVYKYHKYIGDNEDLLEENESIDQDGFVEYTKEDGTKERKIYYGYYDSKYYSPTLIQNIITNSQFDSTSGWIGTKTSKDGEKAKIRNVYGYFKNNVFVNSADELLKGTFNPNNPNLAAYLEITFGKDSLVLNSGPYDNRITIGNMEQNSEWQLDKEIKRNRGIFTGSIQVGEFVYDPEIDGYEKVNTNIQFSQTNDIYKVTSSQYQEKSFKEDSHVYVAITTTGTIYIKKFNLFKRILDDNNQVIKPDNIAQQTDLITQNVVKNTYRYFTQGALAKATDATDLVPECTAETLSYSTYVPVYNIGAEKVRTVSAKESNYFNILQSIAETFGAWLEIDVGHNEDGSIDKENKWVRFKNYTGKTNYANFRYGVNLKDIQRTYASKEIVTKLMVKPNSNQHANNGFCAIGRANSNPSGEDYIYDFRYFHEKGLMNSYEYLNDVYVPESEVSPDQYNYEKASGYYSKIKYLNSQINDLNNNKIIPAQTDLTSLESKYAVADAGYKAALDGIRKTRESFTKLFNISIDNVSSSSITGIDIDTQNSYEKGWYNEDRYGHIHYMKTDNFGIESVIAERVDVTDDAGNTTKEWQIKITYKADEGFNIETGSIEVRLYPKLILKNNKETICKTLKTTIRPTNYETSTATVQVGAVIDENNTAAQNKIIEYTTLRSSEKLYQKQRNDWSIAITEKKDKLAYNEQLLDEYKEHKSKLNFAFFKKYSRFIQEGTWIDEKYSDDELYYADAKSVMYNSCYPKVAYTINVLALNMLPGYEGFAFELGDSTYVEDYEFFEDKKEEVVITEFIEFLDEPDKDSIKVQNFKSQFKDLFQKITATVQQAQYSTGSYEKAVALAEANQARKQQFLTDALNSATARLSAAGQQSVVWDNTGLTITDVDAPSNQIRMIGGAILLKKQDENGQDKWTTGITSDGISANLITAGTINAKKIAIMNEDEPVFRWDAFGITAFDFATVEEDFDTILGPANPNKFVRFDKYGIYGINGAANGMEWHATSIQEIENLATFALTWEGLKISREGVTTIIGNHEYLDDNITKKSVIRVNNGNENTFLVDGEGNVSMTGHVVATSGQIGTMDIGNIASQAQIDALQNQIDGAITSWFYEGEPGPMQKEDGTYSTPTMPADSWTDRDEQIKHEGDLYYDKISGRCYRWICDGNELNHGDQHYWIMIEDQDVALALATADEAKNTANGKMTVYSSLSGVDSTKLQVGDLFIPTSTQTYNGISYKEKYVYKYNGTKWEGSAYVGNNVSGSYSWKFSSSAGVSMWKGSQTNGDLVFGVNSNGLYVQGSLKCDGKRTFTDNLTINGKTGPTDNLVIKAGNNFGVTKDGTLYCSDIQAMGGKIAGWTIGTGSLTIGKFGETGIHLFSDKKTASSCFGLNRTDGSRDWKMGIGSNFGVTTDGTLYCKKIYLTSDAISNSDLDTNLVVNRGENKIYFFKTYSRPITIGAGSTAHGFYEDGLFFDWNGNTVATISYDPSDLYFYLPQSGKTVSLSNLVFNGPYDIKMGNTVVGKIAQFGPVVYGYINSSSIETYTNNTTLSIGGTISAPKTFMRVVVAYRGGDRVCEMTISTGGVFTLTGNWNTTGDLNDSGQVNGYFCYSVGTHKLH